MEAFAKSDDERDFYIDRLEGFLLYIDLDKAQEEIDNLENEIKANVERYCPIPKLTFYETKKIMEGFVNEKVYDIDTKEKLLDIIQSKEARENFIEFIFDHHAEFDKWQQYYQERSRIRIIEWLRQNKFQFVFEEDLDLGKSLTEKLKQSLFEAKAHKDILNARKQLFNKAKTYYSNEALNPRPKRGRPPKQVAKAENEPQLTGDIYQTIPVAARPFLFAPDNQSSSAFTFSSRFEADEKMLYSRRQNALNDTSNTFENLNQKLQSLKLISSSWQGKDEKKPLTTKNKAVGDEDEDFEPIDFDVDDDEDKKEVINWNENEDDEDEEFSPSKKGSAKETTAVVKKPVKKPVQKAAPNKNGTKKPVAKLAVKTPLKKEEISKPAKSAPKNAATPSKPVKAAPKKAATPSKLAAKKPLAKKPVAKLVKKK